MQEPSLPLRPRPHQPGPGPRRGSRRPLRGRGLRSPPSPRRRRGVPAGPRALALKTHRKVSLPQGRGGEGRCRSASPGPVPSRGARRPGRPAAASRSPPGRVGEPPKGRRGQSPETSTAALPSPLRDSYPEASGVSFEKTGEKMSLTSVETLQAAVIFRRMRAPSTPALKWGFQTRTHPPRSFSMLTDLSPPTKWGRGGGRRLLHGRRHFVRRRRRVCVMVEENDPSRESPALPVT